MPAKRGLKPPVYVDTDGALEKLVASLRTQPMIAVDTEANPLFAYREKLCLIQISTRTRDYIIDPLSGIDLGRIVPLFADPGVVKIFHDAEFDMLMLKKTLPIEVMGIFDTKVVATSLGLSTVGLAPILKAFFGVTLDKKYQRSDWGRRPLTDGQLDYARYDTHYLIPLANDLRAKLSVAGEVNQLEVAAEFRRVAQLVPEIRPFNPDDFVRIKGWDRLDPADRRVLRELFVMRHEMADAQDRPAFKVLSNELLLKLARDQPATTQDLKKGRVMSEKQRDRLGEEVLNAIARGRRLAPLPDDKIQRTKNDMDRLTDEQRAVYEEIRNWRKTVAAKRAVDASLVLPRTTMYALARLRSRPKTVEGLRNSGVLEPWRVEYYGEGIVAALSQPIVLASRSANSRVKSEHQRPRRRHKKRGGGQPPSGDSG